MVWSEHIFQHTCHTLAWPSMVSTEQELQSTLLRLCVLCASSLQTTHGSHVPCETVDADAAKQSGAELSNKIYQDVLTLLLEVRNTTTKLSLAMRPSKKSQEDASLPPLDEMSMEAARRLLVSLATDAVPKLAFLANLTHKHQSVWEPSSTALQDESIALAREMGARVVYGDTAKGRKVVSASVGELFAREIRDAINAVIESIAQLCQSFMNSRTRMVLERAQQQREARMSGTVVSSTTSTPPSPSRQVSLTLTKQLWTLCDGLAGSTENAPAHISRLPRDNREALLKKWKQCELVLQDGLQELQDTLCEQNDDKDEEDERDEDDFAAAWSETVALNEEEVKIAKRVEALLSTGMYFQKSVRAAVLATKDLIDFDQVGAAVSALAEAQDDLIASVLYAEEASDDEEPESDDVPDLSNTATKSKLTTFKDPGDGTHDTLDQAAAIHEAVAAYRGACKALAATLGRAAPSSASLDEKLSALSTM